MSARKSPGDRANRDPIVYEDMAICWDGKIRGPELPKERKWSEETTTWWEVIRRSAQAMSFHATDWLHLLDTARLHNKLWTRQTMLDADGKVVWVDIKPSEAASLAGEIRRRTENYGFTWADRRKYGIHITTPEQVAQEAEQATRRSAVDYRRKLNGLD